MVTSPQARPLSFRPAAHWPTARRRKLEVKRLEGRVREPARNRWLAVACRIPVENSKPRGSGSVRPCRDIELVVSDSSRMLHFFAAEIAGAVSPQGLGYAPGTGVDLTLQGRGVCDRASPSLPSQARTAAERSPIMAHWQFELQDGTGEWQAATPPEHPAHF